MARDIPDALVPEDVPRDPIHRQQEPVALVHRLRGDSRVATDQAVVERWWRVSLKDDLRGAMDTIATRDMRIAELEAALSRAHEEGRQVEREAFRIREGQYKEGAADLLDECAQLRDAITRWKAEEALWKEREAELLAGREEGRQAGLREAADVMRRRGVTFAEPPQSALRECIAIIEAEASKLASAPAAVPPEEKGGDG